MLLKFDELIQKYNIKIKGILHLGAHKCEEKPLYQKLNINNIIWVDANPFLNNKNIHNFVCNNTDIGKSLFYLTNQSDSSTIFKFNTHSKNYPNIHINKIIKVQNKTIDTFYQEQNIPNDYANVLVLCIQGSELLALKGMNNTLKYFDTIITKVNNDYVYQNCPLIKEMDDFLLKNNFIKKEVVWTNKDWGQALYVLKQNREPTVL